MVKLFRQWQWPQILVFTALGWLLYANSLQVPFYFDDQQNIVENISIRMTEISLESLGKAAFNTRLSTRPLANLTFALNFYFHQYRLAGYHVVNITIHILCGIFLYLLTLAILRSPALAGRYGEGSRSIALAAALFWFVNPVHTQTVAYVVQRMNSLAALFYIMSLWLYLRGRSTPICRPVWPWLAGSGLAGLCALGSKELAATLPLMVFFCEWYLIQDLSPNWLKKAIPYLVGLAVFILALIFYYLGPDPLADIQASYVQRNFTLSERLFTELRVVVYYLGLFFYPNPDRFSIDYDFSLSHSIFDPPATLGAAIFIFMMLVATVYSARRAPLFSFALVWYLVNLVIESSVIGLEIIFEHRTYLPTMFLALPLVALTRQHLKSGWLRIGILAVILLICGFWTVSRNRVWQDPVALWSDAVSKAPTKARTRNNLSEALRAKGLLTRAETEARTAISLDPDLIFAYVGLGNVLTARGRLSEAATAYENGLARAPKNIRLRINLATVYAMQGQPGRAVVEFEKILASGASVPSDIYFNLGRSYAEIARYAQALQAFRQASLLNPADREARRMVMEMERKLRIGR